MDIKTALEDIQKSAATAKKPRSDRWFAEQVRKLGNPSPSSFLQSGVGPLKAEVEIGGMYLYGYFPKHYKTLKVYDIFPLVLPFNYTEEGFTGLNLHYVFPAIRVKILQELIKYKNTATLTKSTRLRLSWGLLSTASRHPLIAPTVKQYLWSHVKTSFMQIPAPDWKMVILLPLERFKKQTSRQVHQRSANYANDRR